MLDAFTCMHFVKGSKNYNVSFLGHPIPVSYWSELHNHIFLLFSVARTTRLARLTTCQSRSCVLTGCPQL